MRRRIWDWIVGIVMIAIALLAGAIISGLIGTPIALGLNYFLGLQGKHDGWLFFGAWAFAFVLLQAAGFYDYYRRGRMNIVTGKAGFFYLIPRAIERMKTGHEAFGFVDAETNRPTTLQEPINAAARLWSGLILIVASVAAVVYYAPKNGAGTLVLTGGGLIGAVIGLVVLIQACLVYAGFINRKRKPEEGGDE